MGPIKFIACMKTAASAALGVMAAGALVTVEAGAQSVEQFYKGKQGNMYVGNPPGGGYDSYVRLASRHLGRMIPGNPTFIVQHMPGAGGLRVTGHIYNVAPKDGTHIALTQRAILTAPLLEPNEKEMTFDAQKLNWVGSLNVDVGYIVVWHTAPHKTLDDMFKHELIVGSSNPNSETIPYLLNNVFGTKLKIVSGYQAGTEILLAMERGEVQSRILGSISGLETFMENWIKEKKIHFLAAVSPRRSPAMPDLPSLMELGKTDQQKQMLDLVLSSQLWGRPFMLPPGVPAERVKAVREAFYKMTEDTQFLADAKKMDLPIELLKGEEMHEILARLYATPTDIVAATRKAVTPTK